MIQKTSSSCKEAGNLSIEPVKNSKDINKLIDIPWYVHADDQAWVAPLRLERRVHLSRLNPFNEHGRWQAWLAYRGGRAIGRISAQIDTLHQERYSIRSGHFGFFDCINDEEAAHLLIETAEEWLRSQDVNYVTGPFSFSVNQECGVLVAGFDTPPVLMMPHHRNWTHKFLENQGYVKARDLYAYWVEVDFEAPKVMSSLLARYQNKIRVRPLKRKNFADEMLLLRELFNDAWSENWGFVPFTDAEFKELGTSLRLLVPDELIQIAEIDGKAVAFIAALPNINEAIRDMDGRLFPVNWVKLLSRIKKKKIRTGRVPLMGVRKEYQNKPLGMALAFSVIEAVRHNLYKNGIKEVEMSWILEDNSGMRNILDCIGSRLYKTYRLYEKQLTDDTNALS